MDRSELRGPTLVTRSLSLDVPDLDDGFARPPSLARQLRKRAKRQTTPAATPDATPPPTAASFFVPNGSLLGMPSNSTLTLFSGLLPSAPANVETDAHLFFLLVRNRHIADRERLIIWFNGGPGCSSFDGALMEIGPFRLIEGTQTLKEIDGAWNEYANVLFLDQPAGTGYSYVSTNDFVHELDVAAAHVVAFLKRFYNIFPEFQDMDTYLAGESYAGQYIPYVADAILKTTLITTPLTGLLIGNGWIDPWYQYPAYMQFAYATGVIKPGTTGAQRVEDINAACMQRLGDLGYANYPVHEGTCEAILGTIIDTTVQTVNGERLCINTYDVRLTDYHPACGMNWPPDLTAMYGYLPRQDVKKAFHASEHDGGWTECSGQVGGNFWTRTSPPSGKLLPDLLKQIPILLFAGDQDLICNWMGVHNVTQHLNWNGAIGMQDAPVLDWAVDGEPVGTWQSARNLTFVKIYNASHMVPWDVPLVTHDMLLRFMNTDFLSAAGGAAQVPSRIGAEQEAIVGATHPNGTALHGGPDDPAVIAADAAAAKAEGEAGTGAEAVRQAYYNAGSAAILVLLVLACAAIFLCLRARTRREGREMLPLKETRRRSAPVGASGSRRSHRSHRKGAHSLASTVSDAPHELDELVVERPDEEEEESDEEEQDGRRSRYEPTRASEGGGGAVAKNEELFSVGDEDDEDEIGDLGRDERERRP